MHDKTFEKYYTTEALVVQLMTTVPRDLKTYLEPSAGNGAWLPIKELLTDKLVTFSDLIPESPWIATSDYLTSSESFDVVFGNPPYSLAVDFINHAFNLKARYVCFLLPPSFKKVSVQKQINKNAHLTVSIDLPDAEFTLSGRTVRIPRETITHKATSKRFKFVASHDLADIAVRRVGVKAGCFYLPTEKLSKQSNLFLKFLGEMPLSILTRRVGLSDFSLVKSMTKRELIDYVETLY